jgi:hypothetical protein
VRRSYSVFATITAPIDWDLDVHLPPLLDLLP